MFDLDKGMPVQDDGPSFSESPANETAEAGMYEPGGDGDNVIDSDNDVEMGNQDDQDCESDDEGLFREDQVSRKTLVAVYDLAYELDAAITAAADTPAADNAPPSASMLTESAGERCLMASKLVLREIDESWVGESM
ncbi:hypothetical protein HBI25_174900 [Parastagonospora nodorum]|nr:hypothetical protein HBH53_071210 [Parastagonospora nodorum]KAH4044554.1 hypothetical protein HBH49_216110 [Parastagonospora nodorum]KAH4072370.1 hypothetical protein HBH50_058770 [Parastagonospora nodorum]KAH4088962.1 hypothetical protein HBH48_121150 [Parastagonospora nodorum]KAH4121875.1 hypothetical protein HBH47_096540 [Parastagonospora nodorum]